MSFYKNGIITNKNIYESDGILMNNTKSISYVPTKDQSNSCLLGEAIKGFVKGKQYYVELTIEWSGFKGNVADNFACWCQGSTYDGTSWNWDASNPLCGTVGTITSILLSMDYGSKKINKIFTANDRTGYYLGIRTDYSNGVGKVGFSNIKVVPIEYAVSTHQENLASLHIGENFISTGEIIEY